MTTISATKQISLLGALQEEGALKPTALKLDPDTSYEEYQEVGLMLATLRDATAWWIGDWLVWGEGAFGEKAAQAAEVLQREPHTLATYFRVSMYVSPKRRRTNLSWTHHREVASLPPEEQVEWLKLAEAERMTAAELHARRRALPNGDSAPPEPARSNGNEPYIDPDNVVEVAKAIWKHAQSDADGWFRVPPEIMARLKAAIGKE